MSLARVPLRWRLTIAAIVVQAVILSGLGAFVSVRLNHALIQSVDSSLDGRASQLVAAGVGDGGNVADGGDANVPGLNALEDLVQVIGPDGRISQSAGPSTAETALLSSAEVAHARARAQRATVSAPGGDLRLLAVPDGAGRVLVVGTPLRNVHEAQAALLALLVVGGLAALAAGGLGAWWLSGRALRPIDRLSAAAAAIGADDLHERVPVPQTGDEAARLATTLNNLLERVSRAVDDQRAFLADASHELRSPVAVLRAELEVALLSPATPPAARGMLESLHEESDRLARLTDDLLALARADSGRLEIIRQDTGLEDAADRARRLLGRVAQHKGVLLESELDPAPVWGDADRLTQVAVNLLDNALRHTPPGRRVLLETGVNADAAILRVSDSGPGIAPEFLPRIFRRFSRDDAVRGRDRGQSGLGLAIASAIAHAHGGSLGVERTGPEGTVFTFQMRPRLESGGQGR